MKYLITLFVTLLSFHLIADDQAPIKKTITGKLEIRMDTMTEWTSGLTIREGTEVLRLQIFDRETFRALSQFDQQMIELTGYKIKNDQLSAYEGDYYDEDAAEESCYDLSDEEYDECIDEYGNNSDGDGDEYYYMSKHHFNVESFTVSFMTAKASGEIIDKFDDDLEEAFFYIKDSNGKLIEILLVHSDQMRIWNGEFEDKIAVVTGSWGAGPRGRRLVVKSLELAL